MDGIGDTSGGSFAVCRADRIFTQEDPLGLAGGLNLYGFAGGDPVNFSDPFGLAPQGECKNADGETVPCPDMDKVIKALGDSAKERATGWCGRQCRLALEAGGFDTRGHPEHAGDYGPFLESRGAERVSVYSHVRRGDIAVFGKNAEHKAGHIQIFDGKQWISDFRQRHFNAYADPASAGPSAVYRFPIN